MKNFLILALGIAIAGGLAYYAFYGLLQNTPPEVRLLYPEGGLELAGVVNISWSAEDPDEDALVITIQYMADYERCLNDTCDIRWRDIAVELSNVGNYQWDTSRLEGGNYRIKVIASDGVEKSKDVSGWFTIGNE